MVITSFLLSIHASWKIEIMYTSVVNGVDFENKWYRPPSVPEHLIASPDFSGVRVTRSSVSCVMFCRSLFVLLSFFFWSLCCLSFNLRNMVTPLLSSYSSVILALI